MQISNINATIQAEQVKMQEQQKQAELDGFERALKAAAESGDLTELKKVATDFEQVFMHMLLKAMRNTIPEGGLTEKSNQRDIFEGMLDEEFAKQMSEAGGVGLADMMVEQMKKYIAQEPPRDYVPFDGKG